MIFMPLLIGMYVYFFFEFIINLIFSLLLFLFAHLSFIPSPELGTLELNTFYPGAKFKPDFGGFKPRLKFFKFHLRSLNLNIHCAHF